MVFAHPRSLAFNVDVDFKTRSADLQALSQMKQR